MDNLTAGNPVAHRVRVYYENTGTDTIYEGMPLCYNYDTTTNWFGGSVSDAGVVTASTTTSETTANEGRYIRVENPSTSNLDFFAGVVARGGWCGKSDARILDIYVPNGAIVPVRAYIECTVGRTILSLMDGLLTLGNPTTDIDEFGRDTIGTVVSRPVAIAMETDATLDTTAGLVLAKLDPKIFVFQGGMDNQELIVGYGNSTSVNLAVNKSLIDFKNTDGHSCAWLWRTRLSGAGSGAQKGVYRFDTMMDATSYGEYVKCVEINLEVACSASQVPPGHVYALSIMMRTALDPNMSTVSLTAVVNLESFLRNTAGAALSNPPAESTWFRFNANGSVPEYFIYAQTYLLLNGSEAAGTAATVTGFDGDFPVVKIPVYLGGLMYLLAGIPAETAD